MKYKTLRLALIVPSYLFFSFIFRKLADIFTFFIYQGNISIGRNRWNDGIVDFHTFQDFQNNWWTIMVVEFIVLYASIGLSIALLPEDKKRFGYFILVITQVIITLLLAILAVFIGEFINNIFQIFLVLLGYSIPFVTYYTKEIRNQYQ